MKKYFLVFVVLMIFFDNIATPRYSGTQLSESNANAACTIACGDYGGWSGTWGCTASCYCDCAK